jgi:hypothetical protein
MTMAQLPIRKLLPDGFLSQNPSFVSVSWRTTGRCDLNCPHCAADRARFPSQELSEEQMRCWHSWILIQVATWLIDFTAASPLFHPSWSIAMRYRSGGELARGNSYELCDPDKVIEAVSQVNHEARSRLKLVISCHMPMHAFQYVNHVGRHHTPALLSEGIPNDNQVPLL